MFENLPLLVSKYQPSVTNLAIKTMENNLLVIPPTISTITLYHLIITSQSLSSSYLLPEKWHQQNIEKGVTTFKGLHYLIQINSLVNQSIPWVKSVAATPGAVSVAVFDRKLPPFRMNRVSTQQ